MPETSGRATTVATGDSARPPRRWLSPSSAPARGEPARPGARALTTFGGVALLGVASVALPPYDRPAGTLAVEMVVALLLLVATLCLAVRATRSSTRRWTDPLPAYAFIGVVVLVRDATGGSDSPLVPLIGLPILWLALFGLRRDLVVAAVLTVVAFVLPGVLGGEPMHPAVDWRRGMMWAALALVVAPLIQTLVRELISAQAREATASAQVRGVMRGATLSSIISTDTQGRITDFSVGAERLLGYSASQVVDRHSPALFHLPDEVAEVAAELGVEPGFTVFAELARQHSDSRIWTYLCADGTRAFVRLAVTELRDDAGTVTGYLGVAIDATEAVGTLQRLTASEERWRTLLDHLPDTTVLLLDQDCRIEACTGAGAMAQGLRGSVGRPLAEVSKPENSAVIARLARAAVTEHRTGRAEMSSTATGQEHEVLVTPVPGPGTDQPLALLLARDVSVDRARERALLAAHRQTDQLLDDAPQGILVLDATRRVVRVNPAAARLLERASDDLVGLEVGGLQRGGDRTLDSHLDALDRAPDGRADTTWTRHGRSGAKLHLALTSTRLVAEDATGVRYLVNVVDDTPRRTAEEQLAHLADHDPLTGLANRRRLDAELARHLEHCRRYGAKGALMLVDLDHFKEVNDTRGHAAGDAVITAVGRLLQDSTRSTDLVARLGGDEFAVLLPEADRAAAEHVATVLTTRVREHGRSAGPSRRPVSASIGVVLVPVAAASSADLLATADAALYAAKAAGRDRWIVSEDGW